VKRYSLKQARDHKDWTQVELSEASGVDQSFISRLERGVVSNPGIDTVRALETALRLTPGTLVFGANIESLAS